MCICSSRCVYGMAHCKVKSSDDIIINVLETDVGVCVSACVSIR